MREHPDRSFEQNRPALKSVTRLHRLVAAGAILPLMARPSPISLRVRAAESSRRARRLLQRLEAEDLQQRRIRWLATKALIVNSPIERCCGTKAEINGLEQP